MPIAKYEGLPKREKNKMVMKKVIRIRRRGKVIGMKWVWPCTK